MHTPTLPLQLPIPLQLSSASPAPQRAQATTAPSPATAQFSQALSRQMEQRRHDAAPSAQATQAAQAASPARPKPADGTRAAGSAHDSGGADDGDDDDAVAVDAAAAAARPVTDLLALVASANALVAGTATQAGQLAGLAARQGKAAGQADDAAAVAGADGAASKASALALASDAALRQGATDGADFGKPGAHAGKAGGAAAPFALPAALAADAAPGARDIDLAAAMKEPLAAAPVVAPLQQASLAMMQAATAAPAGIAARVGTPAWDNQVGQKIIWMVAGKEQSASLTLNPPDLGPMQVVLNVTNDHATVTFSAAEPEVRQALENALPKLREMFGESGLSLGSATVNAGLPDQRHAQQGEPRRHQGGGGRFDAPATAGALAPVPRQARPGSIGLVDTFA